MTLSFDHILVPYDGTNMGDKTFDIALQFAKRTESEITVLSCIERELTFVFFETSSDKEQIKDRNKWMQEKIDILKQKASEINIACNSNITNCSVASKCIVSYVKSHDIDLIVMSKSSKINPEKIYHESTVNYVYGNTNCPMLNIK